MKTAMCDKRYSSEIEKLARSKSGAPSVAGLHAVFCF